MTTTPDRPRTDTKDEQGKQVWVKPEFEIVSLKQAMTGSPGSTDLSVAYS